MSNALNQFAQNFLSQYYTTMKLDRDNRINLINFYSNVSQMTYSGSRFEGLE